MINELHCPECGCFWFTRPRVIKFVHSTDNLMTDFDYDRRMCKNCKFTYKEKDAMPVVNKEGVPDD